MTRVYVTEAGDRYHSSENCRDLNVGQRSGEGRNYEIRPIVQMDLSEAVAKKTPCKTCGGTTS
jgi:hypothetical protein